MWQAAVSWLLGPQTGQEGEQERVQEMKDRHGVRHVHAGTARWQDVDVVYVSGSPANRRVDCMTLLESRRHIVVEPPLALNERDAEEIVRYARVQDRLLLEVLPLRYSPAGQKLEELLSDGEIGKVSMTVGFRGGQVASLACSTAVDLPGDAHIYGSHGSISISPPFWHPHTIRVTKISRSDPSICTHQEYRFAGPGSPRSPGEGSAAPSAGPVVTGAGAEETLETLETPNAGPPPAVNASPEPEKTLNPSSGSSSGPNPKSNPDPSSGLRSGPGSSDLGPIHPSPNSSPNVSPNPAATPPKPLASPAPGPCETGGARAGGGFKKSPPRARRSFEGDSGVKRPPTGGASSSRSGLSPGLALNSNLDLTPTSVGGAGGSPSGKTCSSGAAGGTLPDSDGRRDRCQSSDSDASEINPALGSVTPHAEAPDARAAPGEEGELEIPNLLRVRVRGQPPPVPLWSSEEESEDGGGSSSRSATEGEDSFRGWLGNERGKGGTLARGERGGKGQAAHASGLLRQESGGNLLGGDVQGGEKVDGEKKAGGRSKEKQREEEKGPARGGQRGKGRAGAGGNLPRARPGYIQPSGSPLVDKDFSFGRGWIGDGFDFQKDNPFQGGGAGGGAEQGAGVGAEAGSGGASTSGSGSGSRSGVGVGGGILNRTLLEGRLQGLQGYRLLSPERVFGCGSDRRRRAGGAMAMANAMPKKEEADVEVPQQGGAEAVVEGDEPHQRGGIREGSSSNRGLGNAADQLPLEEDEGQWTGVRCLVEEVHRCLRNNIRESPMMPVSESLRVLRILDSVRTHIGLKNPVESSHMRIPSLSDWGNLADAD
eukprot:jgi/Mesen1/2842/ME000174S02098